MKKFKISIWMVAIFAVGFLATGCENSTPQNIDVTVAIKNVKAGQVRFRTDKNGIIHGCIGKVSFDATKIQSNAAALIAELKKLKPASSKGVYIGNVALSSTMGPGVKISSAELV